MKRKQTCIDRSRRRHMIQLPLKKLNDFCKKRKLYIVVEDGLFLNFRNKKPC